ncbi:MAG: FecR domain-containing protein [Bdellovibrionales bacterium]|nr:FecR domain-containing protein [Bdellovibrionales bacterium]
MARKTPFSSLFPMLTALATMLALPSFADASCGEVAIAKGDIKVESGKDKKVSAAAAGAKVCQGDTIISGPQSRAKIKMEDGNELNISPDSRIMLETYEYKPSDNKKKVMLNVLYGKVRAATKEENMYNDKDKSGQANTFQVKTKSAVAGVRGTDFLTSFDRSTSKAEVLTFKGTVEVGQPGPGGSIMNPVRVGAGEKTEAFPGAPPAPPKAVPPKEMEKAGSESKAETASNGPSGPVDGAKSDTAKKEDDKKDGDKRDDQARRDEPKKEDGKKDEPKRGDDKKEEPKRDSGQRQEARRDEPKQDSNGSGSSSSGSSPGGPAKSPGGTATNSGGTNGGNPPVAGTGPVGDQRQPASVPMPGGSMIDRGDLALAPSPGMALPPMNTIPVYVPPVINQLPTTVPVCDLCNRTIESGPAKVNVKIIIGN